MRLLLFLTFINIYNQIFLVSLQLLIKTEETMHIAQIYLTKDRLNQMIEDLGTFNGGLFTIEILDKLTQYNSNVCLSKYRSKAERDAKNKAITYGWGEVIFSDGDVLVVPKELRPLKGQKPNAEVPTQAPQATATIPQPEVAQSNDDLPF
jgi:hypothetical protein